MSLVTLTTDFGAGSPYVAAMKGVILSINPAATLVDIAHDIPAQDVRRAAVVLEDVTGWFPPDTVHVAVIDPGVGTERPILYARIGQQQYVAPDNGLLGRLIDRIGATKIIRLENPKYWLQPVSNTFHGRDVMAPVAAHLSLGVQPDELGPATDQLVQLAWPQVVYGADRVQGVVLDIDSFGNLVTNITADMLGGRPTDERACIVCNIYETFGIYHTYADQPSGMLVALIGSTGRLELAVVGDNAATRLGIQIGEPVVVAWD